MIKHLFYLRIIIINTVFLLSFSAYANSKDCIDRINNLLKDVYQDENLLVDHEDLYYQFYNKRIKKMSDEEIASLNFKIIQKLSEMPIPETNKFKNFFNAEEALRFHQKIKDYKVVKESMKPAGENFYDPHCFLGFCFGRAMVSHLDALDNEKIDPDSILKFWMVGDFKQGHWNHHVVTIVRSEDGSWVAFDPMLDLPLDIDIYFKKYKEFAGDRLVLVPTHTDRLLSSKPVTRDLYFGTNDESYYYQKDDPEVFMWQSFFLDALKELDENKLIKE